MALTPVQQEARKKLGYGEKQILSPQEIQKVNQEVVRLSRQAKGLTTPTAKVTAPSITSPIAPPTAPPVAPPPLTQRDPARDKRTREKMGRDPLTPQEQDLYDRMTYTPEEMKALGLEKPPQTGLPPLYNPDVLKSQGFSPEQMGALAPAGQQANAAAMGLSSTQRPTNSALRILQDALNAKSSVVNQPLGGSNLFQQGGLQTTGSLGYSLLAQNLAQRSQEMGDKYNSFKTTVGDVATGMTDTYNLALDQYKLAKDAYDTQVAQLTKINEAAQEQERALGLLDRQNKLQKEMEEYKRQLDQKYAKPEDKMKEFLSVDEATKLGVPYGTKRIEAFGKMPKEKQDELLGGLDKDQRKSLNDLRSQSRQDVDIKGFPDVRDAYTQAQNAYKQGGGVGDIVLMRTIAKITDPTSSVREEEFKTFKGAQSTLSRFGIKITKTWWKGDQLSDYGREQLLQVAKDRYNAKKDAYDEAYKFYDDQASNLGIPPGAIAPYKTAPDFDATKNFKTPEEALIQVGTDRPDLRDTIRRLRTEEKLEPNDIVEYLKHEGIDVPFSAVGGDTKEASNISRIMEAIGRFESGGNYKAIGADTGKGNRAYGKYQVMASNIPSWTKAAIGKSLTPQQFLNDPEAQDAVAKHYMSMHYNKYGNVEDVASIWFSGRPVAKAGQAKDVLGTSVPQYIKNIRAIYDRTS